MYVNNEIKKYKENTALSNNFFNISKSTVTNVLNF